jgi:hypothetical protein
MRKRTGHILMGNFISCIHKILAKTVLIESAFKGKNSQCNGLVIF